MVWRGSSSWFIADSFILCPDMVEGMRDLCGGLFYKNTNPMYGGSTLMTSSPKPHFLIPSYWVQDFNI